MRTRFTPEQLADPDMASSEAVLRKCVHCGFCTSTCPTYTLLGDELDSPRGRIYLIQNMLEEGGPPSPQTVKHLDRCLSCLACMTTCPSGVDYMHLVDHARAHVEKTYRRPLTDRMLRSILSAVMTRAWLFRLSVGAARMFDWAASLAPAKFRPMLEMAPELPRRQDLRGVHPAEGPRRMRVALLSGCVQSAMDPGINAAAIRLLNRHGVEVVVREGLGCCGALPHHLGKTERSHALARAQIEAWDAEMEGEGLDAVVTTTSGCGTTLKDYGFMFRDDPAMAAKAARVSNLARDISELMVEVGLQAPSIATGQAVAYHSACSLQHGQKVRNAPKALLVAAGFDVREPAEGHLCCGSAGTYSLLQPEISQRLRDRKAANIEAVAPQIIAAGNLGCMTQIAAATAIPVVHTAQLLDWATGGPKPTMIR
jgi:glycolate oxidase iron-sulfur subunit